MNSWKGPLCLHFAGLGNSARIAPTPYGGVMRSIGTVFLLVLWSDVPASAQPAGEAHKIDYETAPLERRLLAERCLGGIVVDGSLGEADWQSAPVATNFIQSEPREGAPATYDTEVRTLYNDDYLYFGVVAYDPEPDRIIINDLTRDFNPRAGDMFGVVLDTFRDLRNGYTFETNPMGAKFDGQFVNEGREFNRNWDGVWHVATQITEVGWTAELAIPFKTLRFQKKEVQTWGVNFLRRTRRLNEDTYWAPIPRIYLLSRVSLAGTLEELTGLTSRRDIKITPYAKGDITETAETSRNGNFEGGIDAKLGVGSGLTLDLTLNTDFSQVEADQQQVNLTRFSLFFPEKRDFFIENSGILRFGPAPDPSLASFRSNFGGLRAGTNLRGGQGRGDDLLLFFSRRIGLSEEGAPIPVLGGGRLTGRSGVYEMGFLNITTGEEEGGLTTGENFTVARVRRNLFASSDVGVMFINKEVFDSEHYNRSLGIDGNFRLTPEMDINAYVAKTATPGKEGDDLAARAAWSYDSRTYQARIAVSTLQDNFNPEVGFAPRIGVRRSSNRFGYRYRPSWWAGVLREFNPHTEIDYFTSQDGVVSRYFNLHLSIRLQNGGFVSLGRNYNLEQTFEPFEIHPTTTIAPGFYTFNENFLMVFTDTSRTLSGNARYSSGDFFSGTRQSVSLGAALKLGARLTAQTAWSYNDIELDEGTFDTHLLSTRFTYAFNTRMFLRGFIQYNSVTEEWSSNIRFNIIHRPLSDFFLVYNDRRDDTGRIVDRALIAKFTYLFQL